MTKKASTDYFLDLFKLFDHSGASDVSKGRDYLKSLIDTGIEQQSTNFATNYGYWTVEKNMFLKSYLKPFFAIGSKHFRRIVYIDMFSGPGLNIMRDANDLYVSPGSPLIAYTFSYTPKKNERTERFDSYYFFEKDKSRAGILKQRLEKIKKDFNLNEPFKILTEDSSKEIQNIINSEVNYLNQPKKTIIRSDKGLLFLIFIDPEGLELNWDVLKTLIHRYITRDLEHNIVADIIYTVPVGAIRRVGPKALESTFGIKDINPSGLSDMDIIDHILKKMEDEVKSNIYIESIPVYNTKNVILYDITLITKSKGTYNAAKYIIKRFKEIGLHPEFIENKFKIINNKISSLDNWSE